MPQTLRTRIAKSRLIYLDTVLWNELYDQKADGKSLVTALAARGRQLVLGTEAIYEMARTFDSNPDRAKELFSYLKQFTDLGISCMRDNPRILLSEATSALNKEPRYVDIFLNEADYESMRREVEKLSKGGLDEKTRKTIAERRELAASERSAITAQYAIPSKLKDRLSSAALSELEQWIRKEGKMSGRTILKKHLAGQSEIRSQNLKEKQLTIVAKKMLASSRFRLSRAVVRADLYANLRTASSGSASRDLLPDLDHMVTASYSDIYATKEKRQAKYAALILRNTKIAIYDGTVPVSQWLQSL